MTTSRFSNLTPSAVSIVNDAILLRRRGLYLESLTRLYTLPQDILDTAPVRNELALCYVFQHHFAELLKVLSPCPPQDTSRDAAFSCLLYEYGRFHTDLTLAEAVESSKSIFTTWLADRAVEFYDEVDIYMACFFHIIQELGRKFLGGDAWIYEECPALGPLRIMRQHLLTSGRADEVLVVHYAERGLYTGETTISHLLESVKNCSSDREPSALRLDTIAWLNLLVAEALICTESNDHDALLEYVNTAGNIFRKTVNAAGVLWTEFYVAQFLQRVVVAESSPNEFSKLADAFRSVSDYRGVQSCMSEGARCRQRSGDYAGYRVTLTKMLGEVAGGTTLTKQGRGSMFRFWECYLGLLDGDIQLPQNLGLMLDICARFFILHPQCSIPEMQYLLAMTLSEQYDSKTGDIAQALRWAAMALTYADAAGQDELRTAARHQLHLLMASDSVKIAEDPYGDKQTAWDEVKKQDLAGLLEESDGKYDAGEQCDFALELLRRQLATEVAAGVDISGEPWVQKIHSILPRLSPGVRQERKFAIQYAIGHALCEGDDRGRALAALGRLAEEASLDPNYIDTRLRALFTLGRRQLQAYHETKNWDYWDASLQSLELGVRLATANAKKDLCACFHCILADLWRAKIGQDSAATSLALDHITQAENFWNEGRRGLGVLGGLSGLLSRYAARHRNESGPFDVYAIAYDVCFACGDSEGAWIRAQHSKAQAFHDSVRDQARDSGGDSDTTERPRLGLTLARVHDLLQEQDADVCVDWVTAGDTIYMLTVRSGEKPQMHRLDIALSVVRQWYNDLCDAQDNLSDPDSAIEVLSELEPLCEPLRDLTNPGELLILCPTKLLNRIPLHALNVDGDALIARNPIVYTHCLSVLSQCCLKGTTTVEDCGTPTMSLFLDPTENTMGGAESLGAFCGLEGIQSLRGTQATKARFVECLEESASHLLHFHGHVEPQEQPLNHSLKFHGDLRLTAREIFSLKAPGRRSAPVVCLIGCGSGAERMQTGDEPLGLVSALIYAGAPAVLATLWPIHDLDSGASFSRFFYHEFVGDYARGGARLPRVVDLARRLRFAALAIRAEQKTRAPYYWAGFILHGMWRFHF